MCLSSAFCVFSFYNFSKNRNLCESNSVNIFVDIFVTYLKESTLDFNIREKKGKNIDCCHYYIYCCSVKKFCFDEIFEHFPGKFKHFAEKFDRFTGKFDHSFFAKEIEQKICNKKCKFLGSL